MARILSVSYDVSLLKTRELILRETKHEVVSALGFTEALQRCKTANGFSIFVLGHSIPPEDKEALISEFRAHCPGTIVALKTVGEPPVAGADFEIDPDPRDLVETIAQIVSTKQAAAD